jgi:predicted ATP-dependent serine protease
LHGLIIQGQTNFLPDLNPVWITSEAHRDIYGCALKAIMEKQGGRDGTLERIHASKFNSMRLDRILDVFSQVEKMQGLITGQTLEVMRDEYLLHVQKTLAFDLSDPSLTDRLKTEKIIKASEDLTSSSNSTASDLQKYVNEYFLSDEQESWQKNTILIRSVHLSRIFNQKIFPFFYLIGGRPGYGKSRVAMEMAIDCYSQGHNVRFYSLEDNLYRLRAKYISARTNTPFQAVLSRSMSDVEKEMASTSQVENHRGNFEVITNKYRFEDFYRELRSDLMGKKIGIIFIDYLQLFRYSRRDEISALEEICTGIAELTNDFNVPIVCLSQMNQRDESEGGVSLHLGNFKGASALEQNAREAFVLEGVREDETKIIKCVKSTVNEMAKWQITFNGKSGKIIGSEFWKGE